MFSPKVNLPSTNVPGNGSNALYCAAKAPVAENCFKSSAVHQSTKSAL
jgi:hypothetical protein